MTSKDVKSKNIEFKVLGSKVSLKTSGTDPDRVEQVVALVSGKLREAEKRIPKGSMAPHQVILLALLDLAEAHLDAREKTLEFKDAVEARSSELIKLLESEKR